jgi:hypothetical protein
VTDELARDNPKAVAELYRMLEEGRRAAGAPKDGLDTTPFGKDANRPCLELLIKYCRQQGLTDRDMSPDELY